MCESVKMSLGCVCAFDGTVHSGQRTKVEIDPNLLFASDTLEALDDTVRL